jgi:hypothetical protein
MSRAPGSVLEVRQPADEAPAAAEFAERQQQFVAALLQREVDGVVLRADDSR